MNIYCVTYDLRSDGRKDYLGLYGKLKQCYNHWHFLKSTWLVATTETANELWTRISPHIDTRDRVLIFEVASNFSGRLPRTAREWIESNLISLN